MNQAVTANYSLAWGMAKQIPEINKITSANFPSVNPTKIPIPNSTTGLTIPQGMRDSFWMGVANFANLIRDYSPFPQIVFSWEIV